MRVDVYNPDSDLFVQGKIFHVFPALRFSQLTIETFDGQWCTFKEIQNTEDAKTVINAELCLDRDEMPAPEKGSYYHVDLIGCLIIDQDTKEIVGALNDILYTASNDVWVIVSSQGVEKLVPILDGVIEKIDLEKNNIYLHLPEVIQ